MIMNLPVALNDDVGGDVRAVVWVDVDAACLRASKNSRYCYPSDRLESIMVDV
jgi:hypothetical protein